METGATEQETAPQMLAASWGGAWGTGQSEVCVPWEKGRRGDAWRCVSRLLVPSSGEVTFLPPLPPGAMPRGNIQE